MTSEVCDNLFDRISVDENAYANYKIIRRNGSIVPFEPSKMSMALSRALSAVLHRVFPSFPRPNNARSSAPATRTTGNNATKSSSSGSSDPDPEPRRKKPLQYTRLTLARALNATARLIGGAL